MTVERVVAVYPVPSQLKGLGERRKLPPRGNENDLIQNPKKRQLQFSALLVIRSVGAIASFLTIVAITSCDMTFAVDEHAASKHFLDFFWIFGRFIRNIV